MTYMIRFLILALVLFALPALSGQTPVQSLETALATYFDPIVAPATGMPPTLAPLGSAGGMPTPDDYRDAFQNVHAYMRAQHFGNNGPVDTTSTAVTVRWVATISGAAHTWNGAHSILIATVDNNMTLGGAQAHALNYGTLGTCYAVGGNANTGTTNGTLAVAGAHGEARAYGGHSTNGQDGGGAVIDDFQPVGLGWPLIGYAYGGNALVGGSGGNGGGAFSRSEGFFSTGAGSMNVAIGGDGDAAGGYADARTYTDDTIAIAVGGDSIGPGGNANSWMTGTGNPSSGTIVEAIGGNSTGGAGGIADADVDGGMAFATGGDGWTSGGDANAYGAVNAQATGGLSTNALAATRWPRLIAERRSQLEERVTRREGTPMP